MHGEYQACMEGEEKRSPRKSCQSIHMGVHSPAQQTTLQLATINRAEGFLHQVVFVHGTIVLPSCRCRLLLAHPPLVH